MPTGSLTSASRDGRLPRRKLRSTSSVNTTSTTIFAVDGLPAAIVAEPAPPASTSISAASGIKYIRCKRNGAAFTGRKMPGNIRTLVMNATNRSPGVGTCV